MDHFKAFIQTHQFPRSKMVSMDSSCVADWKHVFQAGYQQGLERAGDVVITHDSEEVLTLKAEVANLKGQITKLKKKGI